MENVHVHIHIQMCLSFVSLCGLRQFLGFFLISHCFLFKTHIIMYIHSKGVCIHIHFDSHGISSLKCINRPPSNNIDSVLSLFKINIQKMNISEYPTFVILYYSIPHRHIQQQNGEKEKLISDKLQIDFSLAINRLIEECHFMCVILLLILIIRFSFSVILLFFGFSNETIKLSYHSKLYQVIFCQ